MMYESHLPANPEHDKRIAEAVLSGQTLLAAGKAEGIDCKSRAALMTRRHWRVALGMPRASLAEMRAIYQERYP